MNRNCCKHEYEHLPDKIKKSMGRKICIMEEAPSFFRMKLLLSDNLSGGGRHTSMQMALCARDFVIPEIIPMKRPHGFRYVAVHFQRVNTTRPQDGIRLFPDFQCQ